jgi:hypothetical protein
MSVKEIFDELEGKLKTIHFASALGHPISLNDTVHAPMLKEFLATSLIKTLVGLKPREIFGIPIVEDQTCPGGKLYFLNDNNDKVGKHILNRIDQTISEIKKEAGL